MFLVDLKYPLNPSYIAHLVTPLHVLVVKIYHYFLLIYILLRLVGTKTFEYLVTLILISFLLPKTKKLNRLVLNINKLELKYYEKFLFRTRRPAFYMCI